ncbi:hypothetical protein NEHOM01_1775 [Nematocida homosporus]|uniref:uncharacterized protein n=1 Tax=Nematocida homosporus TaxID=1912981 RepID=UPI00221E4D3F|nr:uncharacterized protein NEHOM01_1775 [Nematocida homosporus]KAI5186886.1 hypothetical protein NEHOM01_1775 [Nematocida homosporus]
MTINSPEFSAFVQKYFKSSVDSLSLEFREPLEKIYLVVKEQTTVQATFLPLGSILCVVGCLMAVILIAFVLAAIYQRQSKKPLVDSASLSESPRGSKQGSVSGFGRKQPSISESIHSYPGPEQQLPIAEDPTSRHTPIPKTSPILTQAELEREQHGALIGLNEKIDGQLSNLSHCKDMVDELQKLLNPTVPAETIAEYKQMLLGAQSWHQGHYNCLAKEEPILQDRIDLLTNAETIDDKPILAQAQHQINQMLAQLNQRQAARDQCIAKLTALMKLITDITETAQPTQEQITELAKLEDEYLKLLPEL